MVKKYLKNLIWKPMVFVSLLLIIVCFITIPLKYSIGVALIVVCCLGGYFLLNRKCQKLFMDAAPSSYFQDLNWRNVDAMLVGSTLAWKYLELENINYYNIVGFKRNNTMNYNMLKTYHSHLKENGLVYYILDPFESQKIGDYISPCDFWHIHPHIFLKMGVSYPEKNKFNPLIYDRKYSLEFLGNCLVKTIYKFSNKTWKISEEHLSELYISELNRQLCDLVEFCHTRELQCKIILLESSEQLSNYTDKILSGLKERIDYSVASNASELNLIIRK